MRIGIIGAGHIAGKMSDTLKRMQGVERYAVASRELARAQEFAGRHGYSKAYGSYLELVEDPDVDLVYVATPHSHHYGHVRLCLEHGKAVLCEKAFTMDSKQAAELAAMAKSRNILLAEAIWTRYMPFSRTIAEVIGSGIIGRPRMLSANLGYAIGHKERIIRPELGGGALLDLGVYCINFALMYFGSDIERIESSCVRSELGVDMQETYTFIYKDGRMAEMHSSALCQTDRHGVICGDEGYLLIDNVNNPRGMTAMNRFGEVLGTWEAPACISGYEYEVLSCMEALEKGWYECPGMPLSETVRVMEIMDEIRGRWK